MSENTSGFYGMFSKNSVPSPVGYFRPKESYSITSNRTAPNIKAKKVVSRGDQTGDYRIDFPLNERLALAYSAMEGLLDNWDSYEAKAPSEETLTLAKKISSLFNRKIQPEVRPETDGSIGLYWEFGDTFCLYVDASRQKDAEWYVETVKEEVIEGDPMGLHVIAKTFRNHFQEIFAQKEGLDIAEAA